MDAATHWLFLIMAVLIIVYMVIWLSGFGCLWGMYKTYPEVVSSYVRDKTSEWEDWGEEQKTRFCGWAEKQNRDDWRATDQYLYNQTCEDDDANDGQNNQ